MSTLEELVTIFREYFDAPDMEVTRDTSQDDIDDWDSIAQINIVSICESTFNVKFDLNDIMDIKRVGDFADIIERKAN